MRMSRRMGLYIQDNTSSSTSSTFYNPSEGLSATWTAVKALPDHYEFQEDKVAPDLSSSHPIYISSPGGGVEAYAYTRGGTAYLPKATITGNTLKIKVSNAFSYGNNGTAGAYLGFGLASNKPNGAFKPVAYSDIGSGYSQLTGTYSIDVSSISGGSYYPFVSLTTSSSGTNARKSYLTVNAFWSE